jgi:alpha-tubulin suppressor-like RCC1 family protein
VRATVEHRVEVSAGSDRLMGRVRRAGGCSAAVLVLATQFLGAAGGAAPPAMSTASKFAAGGSHSVAVCADGSLWAWGGNDFGQLGDGTTVEYRLTPVQVGTENTWLAVAAGSGHSLALKTDGSLWAWGRNEFGRLGDGTTVNRSTPVRVGRANDWSGVAAGWGLSLGLKADGSLWAWGRNRSGQLGDGTSVNRTTPVQVGSENDWEAVTAGSSIPSP